MASYADDAIWQREQVVLAKEREKDPAGFVAPPKEAGALLQRIGIEIELPDRPKGYIKFSPLDFLVEEILPNGEVVQIDADPYLEREEAMLGSTLYADLIKIGISTIDATVRIAEALHIDLKSVGYAGIKDASAITAQRISIRGASLDAVQSLSIPNLMLRNIQSGKGAVTVGSLQGNRFTLFIRTEGELPASRFAGEVRRIERSGVLNFYGPQRFGVPRFLSHVFGKFLLQGDHVGLLKTYFFEESPFEWPYAGRLRREARPLFGNWKKLEETFSILPYTFRFELELIRVLMEYAGDRYAAGRAISVLPKQVDLWARAYASYLANRSLSQLSVRGSVPETIPMLLELGDKNRAFYEHFLQEDGIGNFVEALRPFRFIHIGNARELLALIRPKIHGFKVVPEGAVISFDLPKAAYATTALMFLFESFSGMPVPDWVARTEIDTKEVLGTGSLASIKSRFKNELQQMAEVKSED
jgi:TruD family tRNA pseudouridine synthase